MPGMIRDEQAVIAHYHSQGAHLSIGEVELVSLEQTVRINWMPLRLQVHVSSMIVDMDFPPQFRPAIPCSISRGRCSRSTLNNVKDED